MALNPVQFIQISEGKGNLFVVPLHRLHWRKVCLDRSVILKCEYIMPLEVNKNSIVFRLARHLCSSTPLVYVCVRQKISPELLIT